MDKKRIFATVVITIFVLAGLTAGGIALYRLGYVRGLSATVADFPGARFSHEFGGRLGTGLPWRLGPVLRGGDFSMFSPRRAVAVFPLLRAIPGLLLIAGIVVLAAIGVGSLVGTWRSSRRTVSETPAEDPKT